MRYGVETTKVPVELVDGRIAKDRFLTVLIIAWDNSAGTITRTAPMRPDASFLTIFTIDVRGTT
jgi:hypothetical protein